MNVLLISPYPERLDGTMPGDTVVSTDAPITAEALRGIDWVVSYGYRHIIRKPILDVLPNRFVNLHIAFLPFNRGAHPNYWSHVEGTPSGVTIHLMDEGIDTGPILAQTMLPLPANWSLSVTYERLRTEVEMLFEATWPTIRTGEARAYPQTGKGTHHYARELPAGVDWTMPVKSLMRLETQCI